MKILVGRLMPMEKITEQIATEKEAHEKSIAKRKGICLSLGLTDQVKRCDYKPNPGNFYYYISEEEQNIVSKLKVSFWKGGRDDFNSCEMPDGVLEELSFLKSSNIFSRWGIYKLIDDLGFVITGGCEDDKRQFLVARWVDGDKMKSFAEMKVLLEEKEKLAKHELEEKEKLAKHEVEENFRKSYKEKVVAKVSLTRAVAVWARDYHKRRTNEYIVISKSLLKYHCRSRMYKVKINDYSDHYIIGVICGECGTWQQNFSGYRS